MIILRICHILTTGLFLTWLECLKEICFKNTRNIGRKVWTRINSTSCHLLPIESARYKKIPWVERLCPLCNRSEIGDEFQYMLKCTHSSLSHMRGIVFKSLYSINSNFRNRSYKALFLYIMSMCDQNILNVRASYWENILNWYASEL